MASTLTVLGSCGAWPEPGGACSGFLLEHEGFRVVLDLGYGTAGRLLDALGTVDASGLDAVVITHRHPDHMSDLHAVFRARWFGARDGAPIPVYSGPGVRESLLAWEDDDASAVDRMFAWHQLPGTYDLGPFRLTSAALPHFVPNAGVRLDCTRFSLAYSGDTGPSDELVRLAREVDLFVCEASDRHQQPGTPQVDGPELHLDAREAGASATKAGARHLMLTHFWPGNDRAQSAEQAAETYSGPITCAYEGLVVQLRR